MLLRYSLSPPPPPFPSLSLVLNCEKGETLILLIILYGQNLCVPPPPLCSAREALEAAPICLQSRPSNSLPMPLLGPRPEARGPRLGYGRVQPVGGTIGEAEEKEKIRSKTVCIIRLCWQLPISETESTLTSNFRDSYLLNAVTLNVCSSTIQPWLNTVVYYEVKETLCLDWRNRKVGFGF